MSPRNAGTPAEGCAIIDDPMHLDIGEHHKSAGPRTMRAARWHGRRDIRVGDIPVPDVTAGQVLVRVERVGLCGTDLEEYLEGPVDIPVVTPHPGSGIVAPLTLGHEVVGTVAECPGGELAPGQRVIPDVVVGCGHCWWCARHQTGLCPQLAVRGLQCDGGLAIYLAADAGTCVLVPKTTPVDVAAFAEPASVAVRALRKAGDIAGATAAIIGGGTIGLLTAQVARARGAARVIIVEPRKERRAIAEALGLSEVIGPDQVPALIRSGRGADVVLECAGNQPAMDTALALCRAGGTVVAIGTPGTPLTLPMRSVVLAEKRIVGSAAHLWDEDVAAAVAMLGSGLLQTGPLLTAVISLENVVRDGFERLARDPLAMKILVAP